MLPYAPYAARSTYTPIFSEPPKPYARKAGDAKKLLSKIEEPVFVNPLTDYGWKLIMTGAGAHIQAAHLLNTFLEPEKRITGLTFDNVEQQSELHGGKRSYFDIYLQSRFWKYVLEMQQEGQDFFDRRLNFYGSRSIANQVRAGDKIYSYKPVTFLSFINFEMPGLSVDKYHHVYDGGNWRDEPINFKEKFEAHVIELGKFDKRIDELQSLKDKWMYLIKHLGEFKTIPDIYNNKTFKPIFDRARFKTLKNKDQMEYLSRIDPARDEANRLSYRERVGFEKGIQKEKNDFITNALRHNLPFDLIAKLADTTVEMVEFVRAKLGLNVGSNEPL